jgi:hypothetical protein
VMARFVVTSRTAFVSAFTMRSFPPSL